MEAGKLQSDTPPMNADLGELEQRAKRGDIDAQIALARHFEAEKKRNLARGWYAEAAKLGSVAALRGLAINLLTQEPIAESDGVNMIRSAADQGDAEAAYVCAMLAAQDRQLDDRWAVATDLLERAAGNGLPLARAQLDFLQANGLDFSVEVTAQPARTEFDAPKIQIVEHFATAEVCEWLIARARPRMNRAVVYDPWTGGAAPRQARTNSSTSFSIVESDLIISLMRQRIAATAGVERARLEGTAILHYEPGEQFEPHFDFLDPTSAAFAAGLKKEGQRAVTFLLYLNDDFEGGETDFPELGWRYKGGKGDAILFWNVTPAGAPDKRTLHAGLPTTRGEKWLLSQWIRQGNV
jgi:prolyl 4-hydroxylase